MKILSLEKEEMMSFGVEQEEIHSLGVLVLILSLMVRLNLLPILML